MFYFLSMYEKIYTHIILYNTPDYFSYWIRCSYLNSANRKQVWTRKHYQQLWRILFQLLKSTFFLLMSSNSGFELLNYIISDLIFLTHTLILFRKMNKILIWFSFSEKYVFSYILHFAINILFLLLRGLHCKYTGNRNIKHIF